MLALMMTVSLVATLGVAPPAWKIHLKLPEVFLDRVEVVGRADIWFFGEADGTDTLVACHWDGSTTRRVPLPREYATALTSAVDFAAADDGWLTGDGPDNSVLVLHWDGASWKFVHRWNHGEPPSSLSIKALGDGRVLVASTAKTLTFDGTTWSEAANDLRLRDFSGQYAISGDDALRRWDGTSWLKVALPKLGYSMLIGLRAVSVTDIWAYTGEARGANHLLHWNGKHWTKERAPLPSVDAFLTGIAPDGSGGAWVSAETGTPPEMEGDTGTPLLYHRLRSGKWLEIKTEFMYRDLDWVPGTTSLWAVTESRWGSTAIRTLNGPQ